MAQLRKQSAAKAGSTPQGKLVFGKTNYQLFIVSVLVVVIGFVLMAGTDDIYSFTKITVAPLVVVLGFAIGFVAILYPSKSTKTKQP